MVSISLPVRKANPKFLLLSGTLDWSADPGTGGPTDWSADQATGGWGAEQAPATTTWAGDQGGGTWGAENQDSGW